MDYYKDLDAKTFNSAKDYMLELVKRGLDAGFDLEDIAEHYKDKIQQEASSIVINDDHSQLKQQIQKDLDNLAIIDRTNTIVFPLELAGQIYGLHPRKQTRTTPESQQTERKRPRTQHGPNHRTRQIHSLTRQRRRRCFHPTV